MPATLTDTLCRIYSTIRVGEYCVDSLMQCRRANSNSTSIAWNQSHTRTLFVVANTINAASRENEGKNGLATIPPMRFSRFVSGIEADPVTSRTSTDARRRENSTRIIKRKSRFNIQFEYHVTQQQNPIDLNKKVII